uniref:Uncharacterized protein n=1 Tax=Candidatus Kentrum sp. LFY TaxID=2126342 RepID=A0A450X879_9GAMM|nr:MAG: hypothetical protein BECKLFY1418C_GA0070996_12501 [Candidatus Kentron sp. LFY]
MAKLVMRGIMVGIFLPAFFPKGMNMKILAAKLNAMPRTTHHKISVAFVIRFK